MSFSLVNMTGSKFEDLTVLNAETEVKTKALTGSFFFVSLGVTLRITSTSFY